MKALAKSMLVDSMSFTNRRVLMIFGFIFAAYELSGLGALYVIVPIIIAFYPFQNEDKGVSVLNFAAVSKNDVVIGRYLSAVGLFLVFTVLDIIINYGLSFVMPREHIGITGYLLLSAVYFTYIAFCLPLYFKFGYAKCIPVMYVTAAAIFIIAFLGTFIIDYFNLYWIADSLLNMRLDPLMIGGGAVVITTIALVISAAIALRFYRTRSL